MHAPPPPLQILVTFTTCLRAGMVSGMGLPDAHLLVAQLEQYIFEVGSTCPPISKCLG